MEKWEQILAINLSAAFYSVKAALPNMRRRRWGRIVNIASAHGLVASATKSAYVAAKHGLLGLTKGRRARDSALADYVQRDLPRLGIDADGAEADR